ASALEAYTKARNVVKDKNLSSLTLPDPSDRQICEIIFLHGGQSAAQLDRWQEALQWYDELRERFPATSYLPEVFYESGYANKQLGNRQIALELLKEVAEKYRSETAARARFMMGEILFEDNKISLAIPEFQRVMYGFGANNAGESIKNWQAKSGFEAGRCSEIVMAKAQTPAAKEKAKVIAIQFYRYVLEQHPNHALASKAKEKIEVLQVD
ncbi:MAG: tetratricopeptide repeat protein, partial [Rubripirellula sp.]